MQHSIIHALVKFYRTALSLGVSPFPSILGIGAIMSQVTAAVMAVIVILWQPQRTYAFGQCYTGITPTRCEPSSQTFTLNRPPTVTSACGTPPASYCVSQYSSTSLMIQSKGCNYTCNSSDIRNAHPPSYVTDFPISSNPTWWQSSNSTTPRDVVSITFNLTAIVEITTVSIQFRTLVPMSFYIEKSVDSGQSYTLFNFFQTSCVGQPTVQSITFADESTPLCTTISSPVDVLSTTFLPTYGRPSAIDQIPGLSQSLYDFVQATNVRVVLTEHFPTPNQNYYYAIQDLAIIGRFQCNGHADSLINGACSCQHYTTGVNCERCLDLYNDIPWERNNGNNSFQCQGKMH